MLKLYDIDHSNSLNFQEFEYFISQESDDIPSIHT